MEGCWAAWSGQVCCCHRPWFRVMADIQLPILSVPLRVHTLRVGCIDPCWNLHITYDHPGLAVCFSSTRPPQCFCICPGCLQKICMLYSAKQASERAVENTGMLRVQGEPHAASAGGGIAMADPLGSVLQQAIISIIFERSWRTGEVPEDWRKANVTPIFKKGKKEDPGNYRPVSLTSIPGKVMEQLILEAIIKQVEEKKVIRSSQHGFTKGKSCLTNLIAFYDGMAGWVDEGRAVDVVYINFSKAFDTVSHNILLGKLRKMSGQWDGLRTGWMEELRGLSSAALSLVGGW